MPTAVVQMRHTQRCVSQMLDPEAVVDRLIEACPEQVALYRNGKTVLGWFVGQAMKETKGIIAPKVFYETFREKLDNLCGHDS